MYLNFGLSELLMYDKKCILEGRLIDIDGEWILPKIVESYYTNGGAD
jgi:hypothetical protein